MTTSFFLIFSEHPWDKPHANLPHLQFLANNCVYSSHTDIKLCTYCLYRHTTVLIHEIQHLANQLFWTSLLLPHISSSLTDSLPSLNLLLPLKIWCSIHARCSKSSLKYSIRFCGIFSKFKTQFYCIIVLLECSHVQIVFLKFASCDNQTLVGWCIPIAAVVVHLKLKS